MISPEALDEMDRIVRETCVDPDLTGAENRATWARYITPERVRALLSAARGSGEGWRPIETAPRDGTTVELWSEHSRWPEAGNWFAYETQGERDEAGCDGFWQYAENLIGDTGEYIECPTHWRPISAPSPVSVLLMGGSDQGSSVAESAAHGSLPVLPPTHISTGKEG